MVTRSTWEEETRKYLAQVETELAEAIKQRDEATNRANVLASEAQAYQQAIESHLRRMGRPPEDLGHDLKTILLEQSNHKNRLKVLAERNNGLLKVSAASDILYNYKIVKSKSRMQAYRIVYGLMMKLVEEGIFVKSGSAEFILANTQPKLESLVKI
jgi:hypothetical protein